MQQETGTCGYTHLFTTYINPEEETKPVSSMDGWQCGVCQHSREDLLVLPCMHMFCDGCLHTWLDIHISKYGGDADSFPCQLCWTVFTTPPTGFDAFRQNYHMVTLMRQLQGLNVLNMDESTPQTNSVANQMENTDNNCNDTSLKSEEKPEIQQRPICYFYNHSCECCEQEPEQPSPNANTMSTESQMDSMERPNEVCHLPYYYEHDCSDPSHKAINRFCPSPGQGNLAVVQRPVNSHQICHLPYYSSSHFF